MNNVVYFLFNVMEELRSNILEFVKSHHFIAYDHENSTPDEIKVGIFDTKNDTNYINMRIRYNTLNNFVIFDQMCNSHLEYHYIVNVIYSRAIDFIRLVHTVLLYDRHDLIEVISQQQGMVHG